MENKQLSTVFTQDHININQLFIDKLVSMLNSSLKIQKSYSLTDSYGYITESLKLDINGVEVTLQFQTKA